jgi:hypothetical protein
MTIEDEQLLTRQETLLKEIYNITPAPERVKNNSTLAMSKGGPLSSSKVGLNQISPRNNVEIVNQKIETAKQKMSRYFAARNNMQAAAAQAHGSKHTSTTIATDAQTIPVRGTANQNSITHLSMEIVRMGSPFFGAHQANQSGMANNIGGGSSIVSQNSPSVLAGVIEKPGSFGSKMEMNIIQNFEVTGS